MTSSSPWKLSLGQFFHQPSLQYRLNRLPYVELAVPRVLLFGPERCGKTSLMFQFAFHLASTGKEVWFLCDQNSLDHSPPFLPLSVDPSDDALSRIKFKYVSDLHQLKNFGACLHLCPSPPPAILIDNLTLLINNTRLPDRRAQDVAITKALAFLSDALEHLREQRSLDVMLLASITTGREGVPHNMYLLQRWFPLMLCISGDSGQLLTMQMSAQGKQPLGQAAARATVNYSLTQSYINVETVQEGAFG